MNSLALSLLYGPTLTSIHDYWKKITDLTSQTFIGKVTSLLFGILLHEKNMVLNFFCCCSVAKSWPTLSDPMDCSIPGFAVLHHLPELLKPMSIELVMPSNHLILCCPFSSCPQSFPASGSFQMSQLFASGGQSIVQLQHQSFQ